MTKRNVGTEISGFTAPKVAMTPQTLQDYFQAVRHAIDRVPYSELQSIKDELLRTYHESRTVFVFGNGGSAATASHMMCDLGKGTSIGSGKRFRVMALTDNVPTITAWANDSGYEDVFSEQLANFVQQGDAVLAISGSGNSPNVLKALKLAREAGAVTLGLAGYEGGKMRSLCDVCAVIPADNMQVIEDLHHSVAHALFTMIRNELLLAEPRFITRFS